MYSIANCYSNLTKEDKSHFTVAEPEGQIAKVGGWVLTLQTVVGFPPIGLVKQSLDVQFVCMCVYMHAHVHVCQSFLTPCVCMYPQGLEEGVDPWNWSQTWL